MHREHARPHDRPDAGAEPRSESGSIKSGSEYEVDRPDCVYVFPCYRIYIEIMSQECNFLA